ncbi:hypothetical protein MMC10_001079 [Thelotrema lepadinum]|nr:hypothetical protein [Thelotrema lepadinum]
MDDLNGLDWNVSSTQSSAGKPLPLNNASNFPILRPTPPLSGRSTPSTLQPQTAIFKPPATPSAPGKTPTPQNDSFASLLPFNAAQASKNLSLKEQQELLQEQRKKQSINDHKQWDTYFGGSTSAGASAQPSRTASPSGVGNTQSQSNGQKALNNGGNTFGNISRPSRFQTSQSQQDEDDLLAAFNSSAPVDASSHFPVPTQSRSSSRVPSIPPAQSSIEQEGFIDDDDPFGLGTTSVPPTSSQTQESQQAQQVGDDDDVLGLLGKPVSELPPKRKPSPPPSVAAEGHPVDKAIAELVDMGFPAEKARMALAATESGMDVQAAVGLLLVQAHVESRGKSQTPLNRETENPIEESLSSESTSAPAWMRQNSRPNTSRQHSDKSAGAERDAPKYASELGNNFFKTANSLWKTGQKKFNKAVSEFNTENDSSQPKWMKEASTDREVPAAGRRESTTNGRASRSTQLPAAADMTDEAVLLEMGRERPQPAKSRSSKSTSRPIPHPEPLRMTEDLDSTMPRQVAQHRYTNNPRLQSKPTRKMIEEEEAQAYISPARRKKAPPTKAQVPEPSLLVDEYTASIRPAPSLISSTSTSSPLSQRPAVTKPSAPLPSRPKAPPRNIPALSSISLQSSTSHRVTGTSAFKLGNYGEAASSYTFALRDVPQNHPLTIVLLTNRALTHLKNGDPKQCIVDANMALQVMGPSRGVGENIDIGGDEGRKDMAPYWGKAMMRRAEALEQLERLADAAKVWKECVEAGVGGSTSIQGRNRCEKAAGISTPSSQPTSRRPTPAPKKPTPKPAATRSSALDDLSSRPSLPHAASSEAVTRLRAANEAAAKADDEKFALADSVAERVDKWRKGKESNLRALLGSLDTVLWADSGWKKVNMSELLNPSKVKINYMKGIAKVHPDKVRQVIHHKELLYLILNTVANDSDYGASDD